MAVGRALCRTTSESVVVAFRKDLLRRQHDLVRGWLVVEPVCPLPAIFEEVKPGSDLPDVRESQTAPAAKHDHAKLVAEGRCIHFGKSVAFCEGEARDAGGRVVARASGTFLVRRARGGQDDTLPESGAPPS